MKMLRDESGRVHPSVVYGGLLTLVFATGWLNLHADSWSPYFRLNLFLHPLLGLGVTVGMVRQVFPRLQARITGLRIWAAAVVLVVVLLGPLRTFAFRSGSAEPGKIALGLALLALPLVVRAARTFRAVPRDRGIWLNLGVVATWSMAALVGTGIVATGGGRRATVLFGLHTLMGLLAVGTGGVALAVSAGDRATRVRLARVVPLTLAGLLLAAVTINGAGWVSRSRVGTEGARPTDDRTVRLDLSVIPLERRSDDERPDALARIDASWAGPVRTCGEGSGCHERIVEDFRGSIHDVSFRPDHMHRVLDLVREEIGVENQATCAGCHVPRMLFAGGGDAEHYRTADAMSCTVCHSAVDAVVLDPERSRLTLDLGNEHLAAFVEAERTDEPLDSLTRWMIGLNPRVHGRAFDAPVVGEDRLCQACHHLQLDAAADAPRRCLECHMEPRHALGLEGEVRNHVFPGLNTTIPTLLGQTDQAERIEAWARGDFHLDRLGDLYDPASFATRLGGRDDARSRYLALDLSLDGPARPGAELTVRVRTRRRAVGHPFPASSLDLMEGWLEVTATDEHGRVLLHAGGLDEQGRLRPGTHRLGGHLADGDGAIVTHYRVWKVESKVVDRVIPDRGEVEDSFPLALPEDVGRYLNVEARWRFRELNEEFWTWAYGAREPVPPITVARTFAQFQVASPPAAPAGE